MKLKSFILLIISALLLSACGNSTAPEPTPDVAVVRTSAASTVEARFTLTAAAFTPTPIPAVTTEAATQEEQSTATATVAVASITNAEGTSVDLCDKYEWDPATVDVNYPDDTTVTPGQDFIKTWKIKNIGSCTWGAGYALTYAGYTDKMDGQAVAFNNVLPGQEIEVSVQFKAPSEAGTYVSAWTLTNATGTTFFGNDEKPLYVKVVVQ